MITEETRRLSFLSLSKSERKKKILENLGDRELTARQISYNLGYWDLNAVKPRLTELVNDGYVEVAKTKKDFTTGRIVAVYRVVA